MVENCHLQNVTMVSCLWMLQDFDHIADSAMDTDDNNVQIKQEPEDIKPLIEDFDSNDGFADLAFQQVNLIY